MHCLFCKIIAGEIPCHKVWEDDAHLAFLDIRPMREGHTLVVPKAHAPYLFEMDDGAYRALCDATKTVAELLKEKLAAARIVEIVEGFEVDHVHVKLVPMERGFQPADFDRGSAEPDHATLAAAADKIRKS